MAEYRHSAHATFDLKYHVIWITKYRYKILRGRIAERARDLIRQVCPSEAGAIYQGSIIAKIAGRVSGVAKAVLGPAPVGAAVLLRDSGRGGRADDQSVHREPKVG